MGVICDYIGGDDKNKKTEGKKLLANIINDDSKWNTITDEAFDKVDTEKKGEIDSSKMTDLINELTKKIKTDCPAVPELLVKGALQGLGNEEGKITKEQFRQTTKSKILGVLNN